MSILKDFRDFAIRGNAVDLAIGVIIGAAFGKIVSSLVADIIMPVINPLIPGGDWKTIQIGHGIKVGNFMGTVVDFMIIAFVIFLMVKGINSLKKGKEEKPAEPATLQEKLLAEIRDLLKK
ncbi:MAG: large conductance mechanosensitive channel protein MscL [Bacteroidota bacterium]|nr:large conductance mechanosensitive channel protein MscL [Bacteroidota bacterium]